MKDSKKTISSLAKAKANTDEIKGGHSPVYKNPVKNMPTKSSSKSDTIGGQIGQEDDAALSRYYDKFGTPE